MHRIIKRNTNSERITLFPVLLLSSVQFTDYIIHILPGNILHIAPTVFLSDLKLQSTATI